MKRPDRFPPHLSRPALLSTHELRLSRATIKPVRSDERVNALRELQSATEEELSDEEILKKLQSLNLVRGKWRWR